MEFGKATVTTIVSEVNEACKFLAISGKKRNVHIAERYRVYSEAFKNCKVKLEYCPSPKMMADTLTKPTRPQILKAARELIPMMFYLM